MLLAVPQFVPVKGFDSLSTPPGGETHKEFEFNTSKGKTAWSEAPPIFSSLGDEFMHHVPGQFLA